MPNHIGQTPLHLVVQNRPDPQSLLRSEVDLEIVELLFEKGVLAAFRDHEGKTALHYLIDQEGVRRELFEKILSQIDHADFVYKKDPKLRCSLYGYAARLSRGEYVGIILRRFPV
jgi:ankyrin repeat protein